MNATPANPDARPRPDDLEARFLAAQALAREAGRLARRYLADPARLAVEAKGRQDLVSAADRASEALIVGGLAAAFPGDAFLGEEEGASEGIGDAARIWVIDPVDGTANFVRGLPFWCVSVALAAATGNGGYNAEIGVIYDPMHDELYAARRGRGATRNGEPIRVGAAASLDQATFGVGYNHRQPLGRHVDRIAALLEAGAEYRRNGSGALALAYVADGRLDGFADDHTNSWDALAGIVLVREAGGWTNDFLAGDGLMRGNRIVATSPGLRGPFLAALGPAFG